MNLDEVYIGSWNFQSLLFKQNATTQLHLSLLEVNLDQGYIVRLEFWPLELNATTRLG